MKNAPTKGNDHPPVDLERAENDKNDEKDTSSHGEDESKEDKTNDPASRYTRSDPGVRWIGILTLLVLLCAGVIISVFVYQNYRQSERNEFEQRFNDQAKHVIHAVKAELSSKMRALDSFAIAVTSGMLGSNGTWPLVDVPQFEYRAASTLTIARTLTLNVVPIVKDEDREDWERFSVQANGWRNKGLAFQEQFPDATQGAQPMHHRKRHLMEEDMNSSHTSYGMDPEIFTIANSQRVRAPVQSHYFPLWQHSPVHKHRPWVNYNVGTDPKYIDDIAALLTSKQAVLGPFWPLEKSMEGLYISPIADGSVVDHDNTMGMEHGSTETDHDSSMHIGTDMDPLDGHRDLQDMHHEDGTMMNHGSDMDMDMDMDHGSSGGHMATGHDDPGMAHTAKDRFKGPASTIYYPLFDTLDEETRQITGFLSASASWESFFTASLPPDPNGITPVIENSCGQVFTFQIIGSDVNYLGDEDLHETEYVDMVRSATLSNGGDSFTRIPLNEHHCQYSVRVYPSKRMEQDYYTDEPILYALFVGGIFVFAILLFFLYEYLVRKRQKYLAEHANKNHEIVASLFPEVVRDRMFEKDGTDDNNKGFLTADQSETGHNTAGPSTTGPIIADFFPNCSVLFADLVGFTSWSSKRSPHEVFELLETLFREFDSLAKQLKVFKVETIGDCYMAATGLPKPQSDHAVRMVRFACSCLRRMRSVLHELAPTLGPDTASLRLRVGIHSGQVTAGVLRGDRARFQLFGDTVNTASRMESCGSPNRIQVSSATAEQLRKAGKGIWLESREDLIEAKGKGSLQTYFVKQVGCDMSQADVTETDHTESQPVYEVAGLATASKSPGGSLTRSYPLGLREVKE